MVLQALPPLKGFDLRGNVLAAQSIENSRTRNTLAGRASDRADVQLGVNQRTNALAGRTANRADQRLQLDIGKDTRAQDSAAQDEMMQGLAAIGAAFSNLPEDQKAALYPQLRAGIAKIRGGETELPEQFGPEAALAIDTFVNRVNPPAAPRSAARQAQEEALKGGGKETRRRALDTTTNQLVFVTDAAMDAAPNRFQPIPTGTSVEQGPDGSLKVISGELAGQKKQAAKPRSTTESATIASAEGALGDLDSAESVFFDAEGNLNRFNVATGSFGIAFSDGRTGSQAIERSIEVILRARSGAAVPDSEVEKYKTLYSPSVFDTTEQAKAKMAGLKLFFTRSLELLKGSGGKPVGIPKDPSAFVQPAAPPEPPKDEPGAVFQGFVTDPEEQDRQIPMFKRPNGTLFGMRP